MKHIYLAVTWEGMCAFSELYEAVDYLLKADPTMSEEEAVESITKVTMGNFRWHIDQSDGKVREL